MPPRNQVERAAVVVGYFGLVLLLIAAAIAWPGCLSPEISATRTQPLTQTVATTQAQANQTNIHLEQPRPPATTGPF